MRFRVRPPKARELPMQARCNFQITGQRVEIRADMMIPYPHTKAWGQVPCEDVAMRIPLPECWIYQFRTEKAHLSLSQLAAGNISLGSRMGSVKSAHRRAGKVGITCEFFTTSFHQFGFLRKKQMIVNSFLIGPNFGIWSWELWSAFTLLVWLIYWFVTRQTTLGKVVCFAYWFLGLEKLIFVSGWKSSRDSAYWSFRKYVDRPSLHCILILYVGKRSWKIFGNHGNTSPRTYGVFLGSSKIRAPAQGNCLAGP